MLTEEFSRDHKENERVCNLLDKVPYQETYTQKIEWTISDDASIVTGRFGDPLEASRYLYTVLNQAAHGTNKSERDAFFEDNEEQFKVETHDAEDGIYATLEFPAHLLSTTNLINMTRTIYENGIDTLSIERGLKKLDIDTSISRPH